MSWLFSQALVEEYSEGICSDGEPSAQWNVMPTPQGFWRNDKMMDASRLSQFGPTLRLLTEQNGEAVLTLFLAGSPAKTYQALEGAKESAGQDRAFGLSSLESLAKYDPDTSSWKTPQYSILGDLESFSETWPRWGTMRNGECWVQPMWERRINEIESGLWPTPTATDYKGSPTEEALRRREQESSRGVRLPEEIARRGQHGPLNPEWVEWLMGWPIGWTDLKPLGTDKFQQWQQQHSSKQASAGIREAVRQAQENQK